MTNALRPGELFALRWQRFSQWKPYTKAKSDPGVRLERAWQKKGTVKDIQGVLRHSRIATTTDVYMQEIPESVQETVDAISAELRHLPNLEEVTRGTRVLHRLREDVAEVSPDLEHSVLGVGFRQIIKVHLLSTRIPNTIGAWILHAIAHVNGVAEW
jgi:hypothetical protein